ncbi:MAG: FAD-dependent oxidoreductase, partial [Mesorhizobium sp.]
LPEALAEAAHQELEALGVRVLANTAVSEAMETGLRCATGEEIHANICVWAAGVQGPRILEDLDGLELARSRQLVVLPTLQTSRDERILALGDCCFFKPEGAG